LSIIYLFKDGKQLGPFDLNQLEQGLKAGDFSQKDLFWQEGMTEWEHLSRCEFVTPIPTSEKAINVDQDKSSLLSRVQILLFGIVCAASAAYFFVPILSCSQSFIGSNHFTYTSLLKLQDSNRPNFQDYVRTSWAGGTSADLIYLSIWCGALIGLAIHILLSAFWMMAQGDGIRLSRKYCFYWFGFSIQFPAILLSTNSFFRVLKLDPSVYVSPTWQGWLISMVSFLALILVLLNRRSLNQFRKEIL
jgi:hypothetical protein